MKKYNIFISTLLILVTVVSYYGCENELEIEEFAPKPADFKYASTSLHYVIGEEITFINESTVGSSWEWHFGDGDTSTDRDPVHKYTNPGTYKVKLIVDGGKYEVTKTLMVSEIVPIVTFTSTDSVIVYNKSEVSFSVKLLNPENLDVTFNWIFPERTTGEGIDENGQSSLESPTVVFGTIGSQNVILNIKMGEKQLPPNRVNVRVNYNKPVKTLFYSVKGGNLMSRKIISDDIDQSINKPFNMGYRSGKHPLTMQVAGDWVYLFDAGTKFGYSATPAGEGNGEIFVIATDGSKRETVVENYGGDTNLDFYYGFVDEEEELIYWADRREGIFRIAMDTRNRKFSLDNFDYFVRNNWLGYYGNGIGWGNTNGQILRRGDTFWWAKHSSGSGIFRFVESDIKGEPVSPEDPIPESGAYVTSNQVRGLVIDEVNQVFYIATQENFRIYRCDLNTGRKLKLIAKPGDCDSEGGDNERLFITSMAIDVDESGNGYLYWAYRGPADNDDPNLKSGIKRYKLDDSEPVEYFIEGVEAYSVAIDHTLR
jgi:hypothetical protein